MAFSGGWPPKAGARAPGGYPSWPIPSYAKHGIRGHESSEKTAFETHAKLSFLLTRVLATNLWRLLKNLLGDRIFRAVRFVFKPHPPVSALMIRPRSSPQRARRSYWAHICNVGGRCSRNRISRFMFCAVAASKNCSPTFHRRRSRTRARRIRCLSSANRASIR